MAVKVNEVVTRFSFEGDLSPQRFFNENLGVGIKQLGAFAAALTATAAAGAAFATSQLQTANETANLREQTGLTTDQINEMRFVGQQLGVESQDIDSSLQGLTDTIGQAALEGSEEFSRLGISVRNSSGEVKDATDILGELRSRFNEMDLSLPEQRSFAQSVGLGPEMLNVLNASSGAFNEFRQQAQEQVKLSGEQLTAVSDFNESLNVMKGNLEGTKNVIAVAFAPQIESMITSFNDLLVSNKDWIKDGAEAVADVTQVVASELKALAPAIGIVAGAFVTAKIAATGFAGIMAILTSPIVIATALIAAAVLIVDDLIVAFNGGESVIGNFMESALGMDIQPVLQNMVDGVIWMSGQFKEIVDQIREFFVDTFSGIAMIMEGDFTGGISKIGDAFTNLAGFILGKYTDLFKFLGQKAMEILPDWAVDIIEGTQSAASSAIGLAGDAAGAVGGLFSGGNENIPSGRIGPGPISSQPGGGTVQQDVTVNVSSNEPEQAGRAAARNIQRQFDDASIRSNSGARGGR